jgi:hypothetical protein
MTQQSRQILRTCHRDHACLVCSIAILAQVRHKSLRSLVPVRKEAAMVRLILCPKFEQQMCRRIAHDDVCNAILPKSTTVKIAVCQDGRGNMKSPNIAQETEYWTTLFKEWKYLNRPDTIVECYEFSFLATNQASVDRYSTLLDSTDIFQMTGFKPGVTGMVDELVNVFRVFTQHTKDERSCQSYSLQLVRKLRDRVLYNQMLYVGICGGALSSGLQYWSPLRNATRDQLTCNGGDYSLFDFCCGTSLLYNCGTPPAACDVELIDGRHFQITSGAALAVHLAPGICFASSFPSGKNNIWWEWCQAATMKHQQALLAVRARSDGPWWHPSLGIWYMLADGSGARQPGAPLCLPPGIQEIVDV